MLQNSYERWLIIHNEFCMRQYFLLLCDIFQVILKILRNISRGVLTVKFKNLQPRIFGAAQLFLHETEQVTICRGL